MKKVFFYICISLLFVLTVIVAINLIKGNDPIALLEILITSYLVFILIFVRWIIRTRYLYNKMGWHISFMLSLLEEKRILQNALKNEIIEKTSIFNGSRCFDNLMKLELLDEKSKEEYLSELEQLRMKIVLLLLKLERSEMIELPLWFNPDFYKSYNTYQKMDLLYHYKVSEIQKQNLNL